MNQRQTFILKLSKIRERRMDYRMMVGNLDSAVRPHWSSDHDVDMSWTYNLGKAT